jgi:multiple sugar transport system permease protein
MLLPAVLLLAALFFYPLADAVYLAFTNAELTGEHARTYQFIGLDNFRHLFSDQYFISSIWLTLIYVGLSAIIGQSLLGMILALLQEQAWPWLRVSVGSIVIVAWVIPEISAALIWSAFAQQGGTLDMLIPGQSQTAWLVTSPMLIVCIANLWRGTAFSMLIFGAGLRNISSEVKESATLDGAGGWARLWFVILPLMKSPIITNFILVTIGNLGDFTLIYGLTQGGPANATQTMPLYTYTQAFVYYELGYGTAIALMLVLFGAIAALIYVRLLRAEI